MRASLGSNHSARCLVLACGNTLRSDDGVGLNLAEWAENRFREDTDVCVVARQQWTPDLAADIAAVESVLFVDCAANSAPGRVSLVPVHARANCNVQTTHQMDASGLIGLSRALYGSLPVHAMLLAVGAGSTELGEEFSPRVDAALPRARGILEKAVLRFLAN